MTAEELIAAYKAGKENVWLSRTTMVYQDGDYIGNDSMTVTPEDIPGDVEWSQIEPDLPWNVIKFVSQEFDTEHGDITFYKVVLRGEGH